MVYFKLVPAVTDGSGVVALIVVSIVVGVVVGIDGSVAGVVEGASVAGSAEQTYTE